MKAMDARMQAVLLLAIAAISLRLGFTDAALAYIKSSLQPYLIAAGVGLGVLGVHGLVRDFRSSQEERDDQVHAPGVAWLLALPVLALLLIAPPALGSFAAARQGSAPPAAFGMEIAELPAPRDGAVDLSMREYAFRALYDTSRSLDGVPVRLLGFVTPNEEGEGYLLTRFTMNCCAADATVLSVEVVGDSGHEADTWLEVEGRWETRPGHEIGTLSSEPPLIVADRVTEVPAPSQPYEY